MVENVEMDVLNHKRTKLDKIRTERIRGMTKVGEMARKV